MAPLMGGRGAASARDHARPSDRMGGVDSKDTRLLQIRRRGDRVPRALSPPYLGPRPRGVADQRMQNGPRLTQ